MSEKHCGMTEDLQENPQKTRPDGKSLAFGFIFVTLNLFQGPFRRRR
ncbi:hypothetical protein [Novosphingobium sp. ZW T3_23]